MRVVILGCGRVGARVAELMDAENHEITVIDPDPDSFRRLDRSFGGNVVVGLGIDEDVLREAGIEAADAFVALTEGDNTNIMASQIAKHAFGVPCVISQIKDPVRQSTYQMLGIQGICPTTLGAAAIRAAIEEE